MKRLILMTVMALAQSLHAYTCYPPIYFISPQQQVLVTSNMGLNPDHADFFKEIELKVSWRKKKSSILKSPNWELKRVKFKHASENVRVELVDPKRQEIYQIGFSYTRPIDAFNTLLKDENIEFENFIISSQLFETWKTKYYRQEIELARLCERGIILTLKEN